MAAKQNSIVDDQASSDDIPLTSLEESLFSSEKLDRASPELWPEQIPGVSEFAPMPGTQEPSWNEGLTKQDYTYMQQLGTLTVSGLIMEVKKLHDLAYQLGLEEAKEMTRGKYLNIFASKRQR
ncbi:Myb-MuvB complex subunit Lin-52 [Bombyx mori]|uniref:Myb-MuvB complex subunit Lin-52 n=1 Tax=Bombyx mori TaxID=7091 RepID=Q2F5Y1_BOMMO|nr:Myb-MuvB complex subunit Lin-52 [Bombyx mori]ABD36236.1 Myb-MuvB complex subunit Lin-52 [Bombyx mori]